MVIALIERAGLGKYAGTMHLVRRVEKRSETIVIYLRISEILFCNSRYTSYLISRRAYLKKNMPQKKQATFQRLTASAAHLPSDSDFTKQLEQSLFSVGMSSENATKNATLIENCDHTECPWIQAFPDWSGPVQKILNWKTAEKGYANRAARAAPQEMRRLAAVMELIRSRGEYRKLAAISSDWRDRLVELEEDFPNFSAVIDYLRGAYALAECGNGVPMLSPILLNGPPGVGKSIFARRFAEHFGSGLRVLAMETAQTNSSLSGSAEYWGNTKPGEVCNALLEQDYANVVFFLDEIDKAREGEHDPTTSLYSLLEPSTARTFADLSYPWLTLNASKIVWICTSNEESYIDESLLDRFRVFEITMLTKQQARRLVQVLFDRLIAELPEKVCIAKLAPDAVETLLPLSPRRMQQALREGIGRALYHRRKRVLRRDIPVKSVDVRDSFKMGFVP